MKTNNESLIKRLIIIYITILRKNLQRKTNTEYSQPLGLSGVMWRAKHTPDLP